MQAFFYISMVLFLAACVILVLVILIQKGRGGGLSGAFGGGGGNTAFGTKTGDVLTWATSILFGVFLLLAVFLNKTADNIGSKVPTNPALTAGQNNPTPTQTPSTPASPEK